MTLEEMREACGDGTGQVTLEIPRMPTGEGIRLTPRSGPIGYILCVTRDEHTTARFDCKALLRWIDKQETRNEPMQAEGTI